MDRERARAIVAEVIANEWRYPDDRRRLALIALADEVESLRAIRARVEQVAHTAVPICGMPTIELHWLGRWLKYGDQAEPGALPPHAD